PAAWWPRGSGRVSRGSAPPLLPPRTPAPFRSGRTSRQRSRGQGPSSSLTLPFDLVFDLGQAIDLDLFDLIPGENASLILGFTGDESRQRDGGHESHDGQHRQQRDQVHPPGGGRPE